MSVKPRICTSCVRVIGDPSCDHLWKWGEEVKTTNPPFGKRTCAYCPASECVAVCMTGIFNLYPCGRRDCPTCPKTKEGATS